MAPFRVHHSRSSLNYSRLYDLISANLQQAFNLAKTGFEITYDRAYTHEISEVALLFFDLYDLLELARSRFDRLRDVVHPSESPSSKG